MSDLDRWTAPGRFSALGLAMAEGLMEHCKGQREMTGKPAFSQGYQRENPSVPTNFPPPLIATSGPPPHAQGAESVMGGIATTPSVKPAGLDRAQRDRTIWSDSLQSLLEQPPAALPQYLLVAGLMFTGVMGTWAWFGTLEEVSTAQGQLVPQGEVFKVQPPISGEVIAIHAKEGDTVVQGQALARLDDRLIDQEIQRLTASLEASQDKLAQTQTLIGQTQRGLSTVQSMAMADISARQSAISQEQSAIATNERLLEQLNVDRQAQMERLNQLSGLVNQGALSRDHLFQLQQDLRDRDRSIIETQGRSEQSHATLARLESELAQTQALAQRDALDAVKQLQQLQIEATNLQASIRETQALIARSQTERGQTLLTAPVSGTVSALTVANVGEMLQPGQTLAEIAPSKAPLILSAWLPNEKAGLVAVGMPVNIKLDAFPYQDYGIVAGSVLTISPDSRPHEQMGLVYRVEIALEKTEINHEGTAVPLRAGQTATAEIVVRRRRILSLILDPIRKLQKDNLRI